METFIVIVFVLGYLMIALEHSVKVDKAASALLIGMICWGMYALNPSGFLLVDNDPDKYPTIEQHIAENQEVLDQDAATETGNALQTDKTIIFFDEVVNEYNRENGVAKSEKREAELSTKTQLTHYVEHGLIHHLFEISGILFFLLGAMTIVEVVDAHGGFSIITDKITTTNTVKLLWIISAITFFFSAALDNLTTSIVMISVLRKLISDQKTRWYFAGFVIISANAGGAWSPIGDVTTTMLWIKGQLPHTIDIITGLILPSLVTMIVPLIIASFTFKGKIERPELADGASHGAGLKSSEKTFIFGLGLAGLIFVPIFKTATHLPPFMGMMLSLGVIWTVVELMHRKKSPKKKKEFSPLTILQKIDTASVLFFLGILLAVSALQEIGYLAKVALFLNESLGNIYAINVAIGFLSAIVDNVPLVAAAQGMYDIADSGVYQAGGEFWKFLAYCAGTGGSALIIGSAAGVAVMGLEKISFGWYLKRMSLLAIAGYLAGAGAYLLF